MKFKFFSWKRSSDEASVTSSSANIEYVEAAATDNPNTDPTVSEDMLQLATVPVAVGIAVLFVLFLLYWTLIRPVFWSQVFQLLRLKFMVAKFRKKGSYSYADEFERLIDSNPDKVQFTMCESGEAFTLKRMEELANQIAHWAMKKGLQQKDGVALYMQNHPDYVSFWMGFAKVGVAPSLINTNTTGEALLHTCETALKDCESKILIVDVELAEKIRNDVSVLESKGIFVVYWETSMRAYLAQSDPSVVSVSSPPATAAATVSDSPASSGKRGSFRKDSSTTRRSSKIFSFFSGSSSSSPATAAGATAATTADAISGTLINAEVASLSTARPGKECRDQIEKDDAFMFIFTSGTTGLPKACKMTHFRMFGASTWGGIITKAVPSDNVYCVMPLYHSAASMICVGSAILAGASIFLRRKFSATNFSRDCVQYKITSWQYIGELCRYLVAAAPSPLDEQVQLKVAFGNGLRPDVWKEFKARYGVKSIIEYYAATEGNVLMWNGPGKWGALGYLPYFADVVYPVTLLRTDPEDSTKPLRDPSTGLCIRCQPDEVGLMVMPIDSRERRFEGYTDEKATQKKILADVRKKGDRCFNTGDLLSRDAEGFFYWSDRVGDTFRWKGENCATSEISAVLSKCEGISDCCVYGVQVPNCDGRAGMAAIVLTEAAADAGIGASAAGAFDLQKLRGRCAANLPSYSWPLFLRIKLRGALPTTNTYKHIKTGLVEERFNPAKANGDLLYYLDLKEKKYVPLNVTAFKDITVGKIRF